MFCIPAWCVCRAGGDFNVTSGPSPTVCLCRHRHWTFRPADMLLHSWDPLFFSSSFFFLEQCHLLDAGVALKYTSITNYYLFRVTVRVRVEIGDRFGIWAILLRLGLGLGLEPCCISTVKAQNSRSESAVFGSAETFSSAGCGSPWQTAVPPSVIGEKKKNNNAGILIFLFFSTCHLRCW